MNLSLSELGRCAGGRFALLLVSFLMGAGISAAQAQQGGVISGRVSNAATGEYLESAHVLLQPVGRSALTGRDGRFVFSQVAPGSYQLVISYAGMDPQTVTASFGAGEASVHDVALTSDIYALEEYVVGGEREGSARAIQMQRHAPNVKNVLSSDAFGNVADENIGNFLQRMPGIAMSEQEGSQLFAKIRGISSDLNAVTLDGTRQPSGGTRGGLSRGFELDTVPADFIETVEVTKAPTPDMDADSIGGSVNLVTKSAFDRKGRTITYRAGGSYTLDGNVWKPMGNFMYSDLLGRDQRWGVMFTSSFNQSDRARDVSLINVWELTPDMDRPVFFHLTSHGEDHFNFTRAGAGVRLDYKISEEASVFVKTMYSRHDSWMHRRRAVFQNVQPRVVTQIAGNGAPRDAANQAASILPGFTGPPGSGTVTETIGHRFQFDQLERDRDVRTWNFQAGGTKDFHLARLDFDASYALAKGRETRFIAQPTVGVQNHATNGVGFRFDRSNEKMGTVAVWEQISGPDIRDPANRTFGNLSINEDTQQDQVFGAQVNLRKAFDLPAPTFVKTGVRFRSQEPERLQDRRPYAYVGPNVIRFAEAGSAAKINPDLIFFDIPTIMREFQSNPENFSENKVTRLRNQLNDDKQASESVGAVYAMGGTQLNRLSIVAGIRVEETRVKGSGNVQDLTAEERARRQAWVGPVTEEENLRRTQAEFGNFRKASANYRNVFPGVHFRYELLEGLVTRASYSTGIGRPNFSTIIPSDSVNHETQLVTANNTALRPQYGDNFDVSIEYYYEPAGLVSAGAFLKEIRDFIFTANVGTIPAGQDNGFDGNYAGYDLRTQANGGFARVRGLELNYQQQFSNLPGFWRGFGVFANHTWLESVGDYGNIGETVTQAQLAGFVPRTASFGITYIDHGWTIRTLTTYVGSSPQAIQANPYNQRFNRSRIPTDVNISYRFNPRLTVFVDVNNVFANSLVGSYIYHPSRTRNKDGWQQLIKFGVSGRY